MLALLIILRSAAFASFDCFLQIDDKDGKNIKPKMTCSNGSCSLNGLPPGVPLRCTVTVDEHIYVILLEADVDGDGVVDREIVSPRDPASGLPTGKSAVQSPRDAASGLPTGKRQHSPIRFYCVCEPGGATVSRFKTESAATSQATRVRESPTLASTGKQKAWLPCNFRVELSESQDGSSLSIAFQKIEMK